MNDAEFWNLIQKSKKRKDQSEALESLLSKLDANEIALFDGIFHQKLDALYRWDLWAVAYIIKGGCSDDSFDYFCAWIIGQGESTYNNAIHDARVFGSSIPVSDDEFDAESIMYAAAGAYESVTSQELPSRPSARPPEPVGDAWDEDEVDKLFPELAEKWNSYLEASANDDDEGDGIGSFFRQLFKR